MWFISLAFRKSCFSEGLLFVLHPVSVQDSLSIHRRPSRVSLANQVISSVIQATCPIPKLELLTVMYDRLAETVRLEFVTKMLPLNLRTTAHKSMRDIAVSVCTDT